MKLHHLALLGILFVAGCSETAVNPVNPTDTTSETLNSDSIKQARMYDSLMKPDARGSFTDPRDGQVYNWVQINDMRVMTRNLAYRATHGTVSENPYNGFDTTKISKAEIVAKYGLAYDYEALMDSAKGMRAPSWSEQGVCPAGWFLPDEGYWSLVASRPSLVPGYANSPDTDAKFNRWAMAKEEGGKDSLGFSLFSTWGVDEKCDTAEFFVDSFTNCVNVERKFISYATSNKSFSPGNYTVYRIRSDSAFINDGYGFIYRNTFKDRKLEDFSYVRCFQPMFKSE